jgi:hypothetical protein
MIETRWQLLNKVWRLCGVLADISRYENLNTVGFSLFGHWYRHYERGPHKQTSAYQRIVQKILIKKNPALLGTVRHGQQMYTYKKALKPDRKDFLYYHGGAGYGKLTRFSIEDINAESDEQLELFE